MSDEQNARIADIASAARAAGRLALDTEFMGEGRYRTLLCLIQLAIPENPASVAPPADLIEIADPLAEGFDGSSLASVLADDAVQIVVHAGRQDVALVRRVLETEVSNVFDTQVAAGFAALPAQSSYDSLLTDVLGVRLEKGASFTRWDTRPLTAEQVRYAREDVAHLLELAGELERRLDALGRLEWAREECRPLEQSSDEREPEAIFARLPRVRNLSPGARPIARELVLWRERTAAKRDRPVQSVLSDVALIEIAKRRPSSASELQKIRGAGSLGTGRGATELLEAIVRGRDHPPEEMGHEQRLPAPRPEDAPLIPLAEALLRARAREAGLAYELLATRADLQAIVSSRALGQEADVRTLRGWRRELVGEELLELLDGRLSLSAVPVEGRRGPDGTTLRVDRLS
jgi:ribonuclease D